MDKTLPNNSRPDCRLGKFLYGLKQAYRQMKSKTLRFSSVVVLYRVFMITFFFVKDGLMIVLLLVFVDDILIN